MEDKRAAPQADTAGAALGLTWWVDSCGSPSLARAAETTLQITYHPLQYCSRC